MRQFYYYAHLPILLILLITTIFYFNFTAEDAYITYRYAENLVNTGALVYNEGEPINAMTSPLHALLSAALFYTTGHTVLSNKIVAFTLLLFSALGPLCGIGVTSAIIIIFHPEFFKARIDASLPGPGPSRTSARQARR